MKKVGFLFGSFTFIYLLCHCLADFGCVRWAVRSIQRLNPVSPMDECDSGCRKSVTSGRAGLTLHRWFDAIAVCVSWGYWLPFVKRTFTNVGLQNSKSGKFEVIIGGSAIGTSTWVIYPKVTLMLLLYGYLYLYTSGVFVLLRILSPGVG